MSECLYQGSFNPIHNAHLQVAEYAHKSLGFDKIVFIPAFRPPHKDLKEFDSENAIHRLNMIQIAIDGIPYFDVSAIEYTRNRPSYTYDTIVQIKQITKTREKINFIIGTDAFIKIETWHRAQELKDLVHFVLFVREHDFDETPFYSLKEKGYSYELMQMPFVDISASEVREKIRHNIDICDIVPKRVAEYIKQNNVYTR